MYQQRLKSKVGLLNSILLWKDRKNHILKKRNELYVDGHWLKQNNTKLLSVVEKKKRILDIFALKKAFKLGGAWPFSVGVSLLTKLIFINVFALSSKYCSPQRERWVETTLISLDALTNFISTCVEIRVVRKPIDFSNWAKKKLSSAFL